MDNCVGASARHNTFTTTVTIAGQEAEVWADVNDSQETLTYLAVVPGRSRRHAPPLPLLLLPRRCAHTHTRAGRQVHPRGRRRPE